MDPLKVCAIVVTFNPEPAALHNLALLVAQAGEVIVVDNGSNQPCAQMLIPASASLPFTLLRNSENQGIAAALNSGIRHALARGYNRVILFDQDSTITPAFMDSMLDAFETHPRQDSVAIFCPEYIDRTTGLAVLTSKNDPSGGPIVAMTSGSLIPAWVFHRCGWFLEELFIDQVDVEYCFRIRAAGYAIARCPDARLLHAAGTPATHSTFFLRHFRATHHSAQRRYYITRNRLWVVARYWRMHKIWCIPILRSIVTDTIKLLLVEDSKVAKLRSTSAGILDALRGRLGQKFQ